jgi:hypothetical protein
MMMNATNNLITKNNVQFIKQHNHHRETRTATKTNYQLIAYKMLEGGLSQHSEEIN